MTVAVVDAVDDALRAFAEFAHQGESRRRGVDQRILFRAQSSGEAVKAAGKDIGAAAVAAVTLFDVYRGKGVSEGKKSVAIGVTLQPAERSLTDAEIDAAGQAIVAAVARATGAALRS